MNERLARHYGIRNVYGSHFRRVTLAEMSELRPGQRAQHVLGTAGHARPGPLEDLTGELSRFSTLHVLAWSAGAGVSLDL